MLVAQQVVDSLHGVKGGQGHLYEYRVPVAHRTVPEAGQLERLQLLAVLRLK